MHAHILKAVIKMIKNILNLDREMPIPVMGPRLMVFVYGVFSGLSI